MKILLYHPSNQHIYKLVEGLKLKNIPYIFYTGIYHRCNERILFKLLSQHTKQLRYSSIITNDSVKCILPELELLFILWAKTGIIPRIRNRMLFYKQLLFQKKLLHSLNFDEITHIIAFHTNAFYLYPKLKKQNFTGRLILEAAQPHPKWIMQLYSKYDKYLNHFPLNYNSKMINYYADEFNFADIIIAPSTFVKKSLIKFGVDRDKIQIIPYGNNFAPSEKNFYKRKNQMSYKLKVAYAGLISFSKGIQFLIEVAKKTSKIAEFHLFGYPVNKGIIKQLPQNVYYHGFVRHSILMDFYKYMDIFYFPTLYDAFGLALIEAISFGLIPIASPYSIAPDIIKHGETGFLVEPNNTEYVSELLNTLFKKKDELTYIKEKIKSKLKYPSWQQYQEGYLCILKKQQSSNP